MQQPSLRQLAAVFFRIGNSTFGSGSTAVVLLSREMTERHWLVQWQADLFYTLARVVPGTNVLAFVAASAWAIRGWAGAVIALLALSIPASVIVVLLTLAYQRWHESLYGGAFITGAMSAIVGIVIAASYQLARPTFIPGKRTRTLILVAGAASLSAWLPPLTVMLIAAVAGYFWPERT